MANVTVSLPDDVLRAIDAQGAERGTSRSGYLRELVEASIGQRSQLRAERMAQIDQSDGPLVGHGGSISDLVNANRLGG